MGVLQLLEGFYEATKSAVPSCGNIFWVPVPFVEEVPRILDVERSDPRDHEQIEFAVRQVGSHHFKEREGKLPVKLLKLESTEEAMISRAKRRPAVVLCHSCVSDAEVLSAQDQRLAKPLTRDCYVVAPMYSTADPNDPGSFMPTLVGRIRALRYPHLACLPKLGSNDRTPGQIVRLDGLLASHLARGCEHSGFKLHAEALTLLLAQFRWFLSGTIEDELQTIIEVVR